MNYSVVTIQYLYITSLQRDLRTMLEVGRCLGPRQMELPLVVAMIKQS